MSEIVPFGQCRQPWANRRYAPGGSLTFCKAGCLVCALASQATAAGYDADPLSLAAAIAEAGAFVGDELANHAAVTAAYPRLVWRDDPAFWSPLYGRYETSFVDWTRRAADLQLLRALLERQPVVVEVDWKGETPTVERHFALAVEYVPPRTSDWDDDLTIMDPAVGRYGSALRYLEPAWLGEGPVRDGRVTLVQRLLMGARIWQHSDGAAPHEGVRGVHAPPTMNPPPPGEGTGQRGWIVRRLKAMGVRWYKTICLTEDWIAQLTAAGITPIVRVYQHEQFPGRLSPAALVLIARLVKLGALWFEVGNEPNLPGEHRADQRAQLSWRNAALVARLAEDMWLDWLALLAMGARPGFYAMAPTDVNGTNATLSSVMFARAIVAALADRHRNAVAELTRERKVWLAVHACPMHRPLDFEPRRGSYVDDYCLRGYEPLRDFWTQTFGAEPTTISTEGGSFSPKHLRDIMPWLPQAQMPYDDAGWGPHLAGMFDRLESRGGLAAMCPWHLSDAGVSDARWLGCGWHDAGWGPRSPAAAMGGAGGGGR